MLSRWSSFCSVKSSKSKAFKTLEFALQTPAPRPCQTTTRKKSASIAPQIDRPCILTTSAGRLREVSRASCTSASCRGSVLALLQPVQALNPAVPQRNLATCRPSLRLHAFGGDQPQLSPKQDREFEAAKNSAAGSLSLRPHSRKELEVKLKDKGYSASAIVKALDRLKELELQSDADYAEVYTRSKWRQSRWAPARIQQELVRKGVSKSDCQAALESVFGESSRGRVRVNMDGIEDIELEGSSIFGTEERVDQQLLGSARRQAEMTVSLPTEARRRRLSGWLLRRGHDWETISKVLALLHL